MASGFVKHAELKFGELRVDFGGLPLQESGAQALGDRAGGGEGYIADFGDRLDVAGGGGEEDLVGLCLAETVCGDGGFLQGKAELMGELDDEGAGDTSEAAAGEGWSLQLAGVDEEEVATGAFAELVEFVGKEGLAAAEFFGGVEGTHVVGVGGGFDASEGTAAEAWPWAPSEAFGGCPSGE